MSKESIYDAKISPHMTAIIDICKEHRINMFATFALDVNPETDTILKCTTAMPVDLDDHEGAELVSRLTDIAKPPEPRICAFRITTSSMKD